MNCVSNVWQAEQTSLADFQSFVAGIDTANGVLSLALNAAIAGSTGYAAATAAVVTGVATTLPTAIAVGAAAGIAAYIAQEVKGLPEGIMVNAFVTAADFVVPTILRQGAQEQIAQCAQKFQVGQ